MRPIIRKLLTSLFKMFSSFRHLKTIYHDFLKKNDFLQNLPEMVKKVSYW